jgi:hypothetical protein
MARIYNGMPADELGDQPGPQVEEGVVAERQRLLVGIVVDLPPMTLIKAKNVASPMTRRTSRAAAWCQGPMSGPAPGLAGPARW